MYFFFKKVEVLTNCFLTFDLERKGVEDTAMDEDFEIALEEAAEDNRPNKKQKPGKNSKRTYKVSSLY